MSESSQTPLEEIEVKILNALGNSPESVALEDLADRIKLSAEDTLYHCHRLREKGLIERVMNMKYLRITGRTDGFILSEFGTGSGGPI